MTEADWLASDDPQAMLRFLDPSNARVWKARWVEACRGQGAPASDYVGDLSSSSGLRVAVGYWSSRDAEMQLSMAARAELLRDIAGNPFRPVTLPKHRPSCHKCAHPTLLLVVDDIWACKQCYHKQVVADWEWLGHCPWLTPHVLSIAQAADRRATAVPCREGACGTGYREGPPGRVCSRCGGDGYAGRLADEDEYACSGCGRPAGVYGHCSERSKAMECPKCEACGGTGQVEDGTLDTQVLAVLADALEEAGCSDADLLGHLRSPGPHVRGCWALSLILGKE